MPAQLAYLSRRKWQDNIKTDITETGCEARAGVHVARDGGPMAGFCEEGNEQLEYEQLPREVRLHGVLPVNCLRLASPFPATPQNTRGVSVGMWGGVGLHPRVQRPRSNSHSWPSAICHASRSKCRETTSGSAVQSSHQVSSKSGPHSALHLWEGVGGVS
jgi:hypothetical protein